MIARHRERLGADVLTRAVDRLRREGVEAEEANQSARRELVGATEEVTALRADLAGSGT